MSRFDDKVYTALYKHPR